MIVGEGSSVRVLSIGATAAMGAIDGRYHFSGRKILPEF
jgi:hypothetical protein